MWGCRVARIALACMLVAALGTTSAQAATSTFSASGSVGQVHVAGLAPHARMALLSRAGRTVAATRADSLGGLIFYNVRPGSGYRVRLLPHGPRSAPLTVHSSADAPWDPQVYDQTINDDGYQYLTTRDGTKLALTVWPPTKVAGVAGLPFTLPAGLPAYAPPYPTVIEYSGYGYADPSGPVNGI